MTTALKLTQTTIDRISEMTDTPRRVVNNVYENYNLLGQVGYVILDHICIHGDLQPPLTMEETDFNKEFMFVTKPSSKEFTEVIHIGSQE